MKKSFAGSFFILVIFLIAGFFLINQPSKILKPENIKYVKIAGQNVKVDLALTSTEQEQGLGGRNELAPNTGMLFVFPKPGKYPFWMKDMNFAIDIIWLAPSEGEDGNEAKVVYIKKNALPESYPESFLPGEGAKYVLEVPAGFSDKNGLKEGDSALFTY